MSKSAETVTIPKNQFDQLQIFRSFYIEMQNRLIDASRELDRQVKANDETLDYCRGQLAALQPLVDCRLAHGKALDAAEHQDAETDDSYSFMTVDQILTAMESWGGGFVKSLAAPYRRADSANRSTIRSAFLPVFIRYAQMAANTEESRS